MKKHLFFFTHRKNITTIRLLLIGVFFSLTTKSYSQLKEDDVNTQYWTDYNLNHIVSDKIDFHNSVGTRFISPNIWSRYYIRPSMVYNNSLITVFGKELLTSYHLGVGLFLTNNIDVPNIIEIRPFQGLDIKTSPNKKLQLGLYTQLEERFEYTENSDDFGFRARFRFSGILRPENSDLKNTFLSNLYFPFHVELFWNLEENSQFNDLMRITPGIGYFAGLAWKIEFSTSYFRSKDITTGNFKTNDIVFRLRLFHDI